MTQQLDISSLVTLSNGVKMPLLGLGTYKAIQSVGQAIQYAWDAGYRHIDTAAMYQNESEIGNALKQLNIPRDQIFVTTKMWYTEHGYESAKKAFETSLKKFGLDYVDLYLVHWPGLVKLVQSKCFASFFLTVTFSFPFHFLFFLLTSSHLFSLLSSIFSSHLISSL